MTAAEAIEIRQARRARVRHIRTRVVGYSVALFMVLWSLIAVLLVTGHDPALAAKKASVATSSGGTGAGSAATAGTSSSGATSTAGTGGSGATSTAGTGGSGATSTAGTTGSGATSTATDSGSAGSVTSRQS